MKTKRRLFYILLTLFLVVAGCWAFFVEPEQLTLEETSLELPRWPQACRGIRIAILSDLHIGSPWNDLQHLKKIINKTRQSRPDLILIPGDLVIQNLIGSKFVPPEDIARELQFLNAPMGVYAVLGHNDYRLGGAIVMQALEKVGIPVLEDRAVGIYKEDCRIHLVGISDFTSGKHDYRRALATVTDKLPILAFTHDPSIFPSLPQSINLTIASHTHDGQIHIPGLGRLMVPALFGEHYAIGHTEEESKHLFVSPGIGTSIFPIRYLVPAEISLLELR